ncbi:MAG: DNA gyrase/topoisomerase IV subunit A [Bacteroidaceae bacterium]|nr:DNA gyrase/topoisomerase IV subunit A [Bacteroidaceae bacterium]
MPQDEDAIDPNVHPDFDPKAKDEDEEERSQHPLTGMYEKWFLDYASYVILERAVPHLGDGLKPVQRRILHTMKRMDDGRYNKVANIAGETMKFHPHGDASIVDALTQMGRQNLLIDCQGSWGNILTGDEAAAPRYIEGRLTKFALDVLFNPKTTEWKLSYDGRNKEPVALPVKFPLLLAQGAEGIAVGLSAKILPHNFGELCDAAISYLRGEEFQLYPDFQTGGLIDVSKYNDGLRGGSIKVRAKIEKRDSKTIAITELPYGKTVDSLCESIKRAADKGRIKIRQIQDFTSEKVEILVHLAPGVSSDKTLDALYAFSDCEVSISPNCCIIDNDTPRFVTVSEVLKSNVDNTKTLLRRELEIRRGELLESMMFASLERIFIDERIYKDKAYENAADLDVALNHIDQRLDPFKKDFVREVTRDDLLRLLEIKMARILKFNKAKADELIARIQAEIADIDHDLAHMTDVTIRWFELIRSRYAAEHPRLTELRSFDTIEAAKVVEANEKLYINRADGFMGTSLKKDEFVENCSNIDNVIIFYRDGTYKVTKVAEKVYIGETERSTAEKKKAEIIHIAVFKRNDQRTVYNAVYRDGPTGAFYIKRFNITAVISDREYDLTNGLPGSKVYYFTANPNGEAETIKVTLKPSPKLRRIFFDCEFSEHAIKGRTARGRLLTKLDVHRITLKAHGESTLGGRKVWFDHDVQRINFDQRGAYLGEFQSNDQVLVVLNNGEFYTTNFDPNNHYEAGTQLFRVEKMDDRKVWTAIVRDADNDNNLYLKRFLLERTSNARHLSFAPDNPKSQILAISDEAFPRFKVIFGGADSHRPPLEIDAEEFVMVKGFKARGKRITTLKVDSVETLEPTRFAEPTEGENAEPEGEASADGLQQHVKTPTQSEEDLMDDLTGQLKLFS